MISLKYTIVSVVDTSECRLVSRRHDCITISQSQRLSHIAVFEWRLLLPMWGNRSVVAVSRYSRPHPRDDTPLDARPTAVLVYHRQIQPKGQSTCPPRHKEMYNICFQGYDCLLFPRVGNNVDYVSVLSAA